MKQKLLYFAFAAVHSILLLASVPGSAAPAVPFLAKVPNPSGLPAVVEASTDLRTWLPVFTNNTGGSVISFSDSGSVGLSSRFYRAVTLSGGASPSLPDLAQSSNTVFQGGEGFNSVQFAPDGRLGFIFWKGQQLMLRERSNAGVWSEQLITSGGNAFQTRSYDEHRFQPHAALIYDTSSVPNVLRLGAGSVWRHVRNASGTWSSVEQIGTSPAGSNIALFSATGGPNNSLHMAFVSSDTRQVTYASNKSGTWQWSTAATVSGNPRGFLQQSWAPRFFALAVTANNHAHLVYTPEFKMPSPEGYLRPDSALAHASNESGTWQTRILSTVADASGDAGTGASIAIAPDGQPAVASWYNERASTGSSQWSRLQYFKRDANGSWSAQTVAGRPDTYIAGDGERGIGFAPYLRFDTQGRAHILFSDHASQHFSNSGQNEYAGQIRHALLSGSQWSLRTLISQSNPLQSQMIYPAFAIRNNELFVTTLERSTVWGPDTWPRTVQSTYRFQARSFSF